MPVYKLINYKEKSINEIAKKSKKSISEVSYILTVLEMEGAIKKLPGNNFIKN